MTNKKIDFYFDYLSPWAFFSHVQLDDYFSSDKVEINYIPVPYPFLSKAWGQRAVATLPPKRLFINKFAYRYGHKHNIEFNIPRFHPFNPLLALRMSLKSVAGIKQKEIISCLFKACYVDKVKMDSEDELKNYLIKHGLDFDKLYAKASHKEAKDELKSITQKAFEIGIWGVPSFYLDNEVFWGVDQLEYIKDYLDGIDPLQKIKDSSMLLSQADWGLNHQ